MRTTLIAALLGALAAAQTNLSVWEADGQIWLTWDDTTGGTGQYEVWASGTDLVAAGTVTGAVPVGRVLPADWQAGRLGLVLPGATFTIPDGAGGTQTLAAGRALFVDTPHQTTARSYAVVTPGSTAVTAANGSPLVTPTLAPVQCHEQGVTTRAGHTVRIFAHWVDGRADNTDQRPDYPVQGNATFHGMPQVFALSEPLNAPASPAPAVLGLHGGGGNWHTWLPGSKPNIGLSFTDAFLITFDTVMLTASGTHTYAHGGYWEGIDRFAPSLPSPLPDDALIVNYGQRRILWALDWLQANASIDPDRISIVGHSGGSRGGSALARCFPNRFAAFTSFSTAFVNGPNVIYGTPTQALTFAAPGNPTTVELFDEGRIVAPAVRDAPVTRHVIGRNDTAGPTLWTPDQVAGATAAYESGFGIALFWDEREHSTNTWAAEYFNLATPLRAETMTRYRRNESYPSFGNDDADLITAGRQPDLGNGDPLDGDLHGTWGGYFDWEQPTLTDTPGEWACTLFVTALSAQANDNFAGPRRCDVTIRRPQQFTPAPGADLTWELEDAASGALLQSGTALADLADATVTIRDLTILPDPARVRLTVRTCSAPLHPGTVDDLRLRIGVNGPLVPCSVVAVLPGDLLTLNPDSPGGALDTLPPLVAAQLFPTAGAPPQTQAFPELWLSTAASPLPVLLLDGTAGPFGPVVLAPGGVTLGPFAVAGGLAGQSMMVQALVATPTAANGIFAASAAVRVDFAP